MEDASDATPESEPVAHVPPIRLVGFDEVPVQYANEVYVIADPLALQLVFSLFAPPSFIEASERQRDEAQGFTPAQVLARVVVSPLLAERLIKLLQQRLALHHQFAEQYSAMLQDQEAEGGIDSSTART